MKTNLSVKKLLKINNKYLRIAFDFFLLFSIIYLSSNVAFHHQNSLYFQTLLESNVLTYRYPPATYLFPDFFIYYFISLLDLQTWQIINLGGIILFTISIYCSFLLLGNTTALIVFVIALLITNLAPFRLMYHFGIIPLSFLYIIFARNKFRYFILFFAIISDPLFVIFWLVFPIISSGNRYNYKEFAVVMTSLLFAIFLNETSIAFVLLFFVSFFFSVPILFLKLFKRGVLLKEPYKFFIIIFGILSLLIATIYDRQLDRYAIPLIISVLLTLFYQKHDRIINFKRSTVLYLLIIFSSVIFFRSEDIFYGKNKDLFSSYNCAVEEINNNRINTIATTDSHTKSLFLSNEKQNSQLSVVQIDPANKILDTWISPYETHLYSSKHLFVEKGFCSIKNSLCINPYGTEIKFKKKTDICDNFILLNTYLELPINSFSKFGDSEIEIKLNRLRYNIKVNYEKAMGIIKR